MYYIPTQLQLGFQQMQENALLVHTANWGGWSMLKLLSSLVACQFLWNYCSYCGTLISILQIFEKWLFGYNEARLCTLCFVSGFRNRPKPDFVVFLRRLILIKFFFQHIEKLNKKQVRKLRFKLKWLNSTRILLSRKTDLSLFVKRKKN